MRNGPANSPTARDAVKLSREILEEVGIDPDGTKKGPDSRWNLVWAPNRGHSKDYATNVLNALCKVRHDKEGIKEVLRQQALLFIAGTNT